MTTRRAMRTLRAGETPPPCLFDAHRPTDWIRVNVYVKAGKPWRDRTVVCGVCHPPGVASYELANPPAD